MNDITNPQAPPARSPTAPGPARRIPSLATRLAISAQQQLDVGNANTAKLLNDATWVAIKAAEVVTAFESLGAARGIAPNLQAQALCVNRLDELKKLLEIQA